MLIMLLLLLVYIARSNDGLGVVAKFYLLEFDYCQYNKAQWKKLTPFLKILGAITGDLLFSFIYVFIYSF